MDLDGHRIVEYNPIDPDGYAWSGSWFNAKAFLGEAISAGTAAFAIKGGGRRRRRDHEHRLLPVLPELRSEFMPNDIYVLVRASSTCSSSTRRMPRSIRARSARTPTRPATTATRSRLPSASLRSRTARSPCARVGDVTGTRVSGPVSHADAPHRRHDRPLQRQGRADRRYGDDGRDVHAPRLRSLPQQADAVARGRRLQQRKYITTVRQQLRKNVNNKYPGHVRLRHAIRYPELGLPNVTS